MRFIFSAVLFSSLMACAPDKETSTRFLAKEMCSCVFLVGKSERLCRDEVRLALLTGDVKVNIQSKRTIASTEKGDFKSVFAFDSKRFGCASVETD